MNVRYGSQNFVDFGVKRRLRAEKDVSIGMHSIIAKVHERCVSTDLTITAANELEKPQDGTLGHFAETKRRLGGQ